MGEIIKFNNKKNKITDQQKQQLKNLESIVTDLYKDSEEFIYEKDKILKKKFDFIINEAVKNNWLNSEQITLYMKKIEKIFNTYEEPEIGFVITNFTYLVDLLTEKILTESFDTINLIINIVNDEEISCSLYSKIAEVFMEKIIKEKIIELKNKNSNIDSLSKTLVSDISFDNQKDYIINECLKYLERSKNNIDKENLLDKIDEKENIKIKEIYDFIKEQVEFISDLDNDIFNENIYNNIKKINYMNFLEIAIRDEYIGIVKIIFKNRSIGIIEQIKQIVEITQMYYMKFITIIGKEVKYENRRI